MKYNSKKRSKYVEKYFDGKKRGLVITSFILFVVGALLVACSYVLDLSDLLNKIFLFAGLGIGTIFLVIFLIALVCRRTPIKEKQYELLVKEDRFLAYEKIVEKLNVSIKDLTNTQPILIFSPVWNYSSPNKFIYTKKYNKYHYMLEQFQSITFGKEAIYLYTNVINHATGISYENRTLEFPYNNIVSVETRFAVEKLMKNYREALFLEITLRSGKTVNVCLRERLIESPVLENDQLSDVEKQLILDIKKAIRTRR